MQDIGDLEGYVRATDVMLFFLSKHYFTSRNCLREVKATIDEKLPLVLVHEQQEEKGGGPLQMMRMECHEKMRPYVFDERAPIAWHRILHYQNLTLKLIATEMLRHGPKYNDSLGGGWISLRIALVFPQILATPLPPPLPPLATPKGVVRSELRVVRSEPRVVKGGKF